MTNDAQDREREVLDTAISIIRERLDPDRVLLFGSRAKEYSNSRADFDIAADLEEPDVRAVRKLKEQIDNASGLYKVDVVFLKSVEDGFRDIILGTGKVVYERG